ncbi:MAG: M20 family metallopeptidase [Betaproteobacteria bacterium]|nr:MAG: M20 family metallopeptidase [Betaproteobacteria bacterium]
MARLPNRFASRSPGRDEIVARTMRWFDDGNLLSLLRPRIARRTESQRADSTADLTAYLTEEITPTLEALGFVSRLVDNPTGGTPFLIARRHEGDDLPTVLTYAHGDVIHGYDTQWRTGLSPWNIVVEGDRWYGRGTADNKGQHTINLAALAQVLAYKGALGFNVTLLMEMGEEIGSPGLRAFCERERTALAADVLIASDGPRLSAGRPTLFLGSRGAFNFELGVDLRAAAHHSGNWGGLLANAGTVLANAIAALVDRRGRILVSALRPPPIPASVARALADIAPGETGGPAIDADWGEPGLTPAERVFGWNALEVLAFKTGNPERPVNAIPPRASAHMQLRFVVGCDVSTFAPAIRAHLDANGFSSVSVSTSRAETMAATRLDPDHPWVKRVAASIERTTGIRPAILPNLGGTLPNDCFADVLGLPTVWIPHSYPACAQHAPDEHLLAPVARQGLAIMAGLFCDLDTRDIIGDERGPS